MSLDSYHETQSIMNCKFRLITCDKLCVTGNLASSLQVGTFEMNHLK